MSKSIKRILICLIFLCILISAYIFIVVPRSFSIKDYEEEISFYSTLGDLYAEPIRSKPEAYFTARKLIRERYVSHGIDIGPEYNKVYSISFDKDNDCWYIKRCYLDTYLGCAVGGTVNVLIRSDGTVLAVWIDM